MDTEQPEPIVIPHRELSPEALRGVMESFVLREGTDYGEREVSLEQKVAQVLRQLERGEPVRESGLRRRRLPRHLRADPHEV